MNETVFVLLYYPSSEVPISIWSFSAHRRPAMKATFVDRRKGASNTACCQAKDTNATMPITHTKDKSGQLKGNKRAVILLFNDDEVVLVHLL